MESSSGQRDLLTALVQSFRYSEAQEVEELVGAIRESSPPHEVAALLKRNIDSLRDRGRLWSVGVGELQSAFTQLRLFPENDFNSIQPGNSEQHTSPDEGKSPQQINVPQASRAGPNRADLSNRNPSTREQLMIYQRWMALFGSRPSAAADSFIERRPGDPANDPSQKRWDKGLWRHMANLHVSDEADPSGSSESRESWKNKNRQDWHPALQEHEESEQAQSDFDFPLNFEPADADNLREISSLITAQDLGTDAGWVEILQAGADSYGGYDADGPRPYHIEFSRFPLYTVQPVVAMENSPLSRVITDYRDAARAAIESSTAPIDILGPDGIEVDLFFRDRRPEDNFNVCNWAAELSRSFEDWDIYVRLAGCLSLTYVMRWLLIPTMKRYADVPDILKPLPIQRMTPHHVAIDFIPLPPIRDALVRNFRDWVTALPAAQISVNWTGTMDEAVVRDEEFGYLRLSEAFEKHVTDYDNWSVGESILKTFPELRRGIKLDTGH